MSRLWIALILSGLAAVHNHIGTAVAEFDRIGVCYGTAGTNIPDPKTAVELCHKYGFKKIRLLASNYDMMQALIYQNIAVSIGIANEELAMVAASFNASAVWYDINVSPFVGKMLIEYIVVGNEAIPGPYANYVVPALKNVKQLLWLRDQGSIKVTTAVSTSVLGATFPPSKGVFKAETRRVMVDVLKSIAENKRSAVLMVNVFPYRYHAAGLIRQDFATFATHKPVYRNGGHAYWNMLDALLDAFYSAMIKDNMSVVRLLVGASGWPSAGNGRFSTPTLAATYNQNFMRRLVRGQGTGDTGSTTRFH